MADKHRNVLLVDDEPFLIEALAEYLMEFDREKYTILTATSGSEAIETLSCTEIWIVISDIYMIEISGMQLLKLIKEKYPNISVVLMTAYDSEEIRDEAKQNGCVFFIEKPFKFSQVRKLILKHIDKMQKSMTNHREPLNLKALTDQDLFD